MTPKAGAGQVAPLFGLAADCSMHGLYAREDIKNRGIRTEKQIETERSLLLQNLLLHGSCSKKSWNSMRLWVLPWKPSQSLRCQTIKGVDRDSGDLGSYLLPLWISPLPGQHCAMQTLILALALCSALQPTTHTYFLVSH